MNNLSGVVRSIFFLFGPDSMWKDRSLEFSHVALRNSEMLETIQGHDQLL